MTAFLSNIKKEGTLILRGLKDIHRLQPGTLLSAISSGLFSSFYPFISIYFSSLIITELSSPERSIERVINLVILTIVLNFLCKLLITFSDQMIDTLQYILGHKKELDMVGKAYELDYADMDNPDVRQKREKLNRGRYSRGIKAIAVQLNMVIRYTCSIVISLALITEMFTSRSTGITPLDYFINSPLTALCICLLLAFSIFYAVRTNAISQKKQFEVMDKSGPHFNYDKFYTYQLSTEYNAGKDIRLYEQKNLIQKEISLHLHELFNISRVVPEMNAKFWSINSALQVILNIITYLFVGLKALAGAFGIGNIVLYTGAITQFGQGFSGLVQALYNIKQNSDYLAWHYDFLDLPNRKESGTKPIDLEMAKDAVIEFKDVSFIYPGSDKYSLKNISIRFNVGERVAVVGKNGSGKTTFIKLLCRLYDPTEGEILLNGINIKDYHYKDYLAVFSVVFQDFSLFSCTLGENIASASDYNAEKVSDCIYKAGLNSRMSYFPDGIETQLYNEFSEEGVEISGGEAQKVAMARALYKDAPFIVLDEPTAALDPIAEADIYARLNDLIQGKTAIYISHRLSSCCFCNQIAVFDQGQLTQYGTHKQLLEQESSLYHELWHAQAQYYA